MLKTQTKILKYLEQRFGKMNFDNIHQYTIYRVNLFYEIPEKYHENVADILDMMNTFSAEEMNLYLVYCLFDKIPKKYHKTIIEILEIIEAEDKCCE